MVLFDGKTYVRGVYAEKGKVHENGGSATILQVARSFYFIDQEVPLEGERTVTKDKLEIAIDGAVKYI